MLGCDIDTKPNNGLFHGDLKTPLKKLVKFNKNINKINQTYIGNKISKTKKQFLCRKIAKFRQKFFLLMSTGDKNVKISAQCINGRSNIK
jgi:hypothetical protein